MSNVPPGIQIISALGGASEEVVIAVRRPSVSCWPAALRTSRNHGRPPGSTARRAPDPITSHAAAAADGPCYAMRLLSQKFVLSMLLCAVAGIAQLPSAQLANAFGTRGHYR